MPDVPLSLGRAIEEWLLDLSWKWETGFAGGSLLRDAEGEVLATVGKEGPGFWGVGVVLAPGMPESDQGQRVTHKEALLVASSVALLNRVVHRVPTLWVNDDGAGGSGWLDVRLSFESSPDDPVDVGGLAPDPDGGWATSTTDGGGVRWWPTRDLALGDLAVRSLVLVGRKVAPEDFDPNAEIDLELLERTRREVDRLG